jgi:hypothetical protein
MRAGVQCCENPEYPEYPEYPEHPEYPEYPDGAALQIGLHNDSIIDDEWQYASRAQRVPSARLPARPPTRPQ